MTNNFEFVFCYSIIIIILIIIVLIKTQKNSILVSSIIIKNNTKIVYIIFGTRPEVIKLYPIIQELKRNIYYFTTIVICTYQ